MFAEQIESSDHATLIGVPNSLEFGELAYDLIVRLESLIGMIQFEHRPGPPKVVTNASEFLLRVSPTQVTLQKHLNGVMQKVRADGELMRNCAEPTRNVIRHPTLYEGNFHALPRDTLAQTRSPPIDERTASQQGN